jgi:gliding motility-associated-like protein
VLLSPAIDKAANRQVFLHNPGAYDADGDSLAFHLVPCQQVPGGVEVTFNPPGNNIPRPATCPGYVMPVDPSVSPLDPAVQVPYNGVPAGQPGAPAIFVQDAVTGQITWNAPVRVGYYNVAFVVEEWRRTSARGRRLIGEVIRDMQIIVRPTNNLRPILTIPPDICVVANQTVDATITAVDPAGPGTSPTRLVFSAYSGILPPATFDTATVTANPPRPRGSARFRWLTDCNDVQRSPYLVVFKVQDTPPPNSNDPILIDEQVWRITVVGPPPQNLLAVPTVNPGNGRNRVRLSWDRYTCQNASKIRIYRKENQSGFTPGACETGIPASAGYTFLTEVDDSTRSYVDDNIVNGIARGLDRGKTYCYRIYAEFPLPAGGASIASQEACATFPGRMAMLKNVDVERTDASQGQIAVRWTRPRAAPDFSGPLGYRLLRAQGNATPSLVRTFASINDTSFVDTGINTRDFQYTYQLDFFYLNPTANITVTETSPTASSVRLSTQSNGLNNTINVSWSYQVPWDNTAQPVKIFRRNPGSTSYVQVATAPTGPTSGSYTDADPSLRKYEEYCYYVQTDGRYPTPDFLRSLLNRSQEQCVEITDVPCTPVLTLLPPNCDSLKALPGFPQPGQRYSNRLTWLPGSEPAGCSTDALYYRIFYAATAGSPLMLLDSTTLTRYTHRELLSQSGCYAVQAVARGRTSSALSNTACQSSCTLPGSEADNGNYLLMPNIFTPNGDGQNDTFRPKANTPLRQIHFTAYSRWGVKVFENTTTQEVFINWNGGSPAQGEAGSSAKPVADGVYYYVADVEFADTVGTRKTYKGWVEVIR